MGTLLSGLAITPILVAAAAGFVLSFLWYWFLGKTWAAQAGVPPGSGDAVRIDALLGQLIANGLMALGVAVLLELSGQSGLLSGLFWGGIVAVLLMAPANASKLLWESKPIYFLIDWGYQALACLVTGGIVGLRQS